MGLIGRVFGRPAPGVGNPNVGGTSLVAAGFRVTHQGSDQLRRLIQPWQSRAFSYYDQLGEIKYASQFYARMLSPLRLYAAEKDANGDWVETNFAPAVEALERVQDPGGGRESLLGSYGRLMFLAGECYLLCSINPETKEEQWEMLSTDELRIQQGTYIRYRAPSLAAENLHEISDEEWELNGDRIDGALAFRLWKRHPRYSMLADATMMGVLDLCVAEGSLVSTTRGPVPIEEVTTDDQVFTWTADGVGCRYVSRHLDRGVQPVVKVTAGRRTIRATTEHRVLVLRKDRPGKGHSATYECEWVEAGTLEPGDHLVSFDHAPDYGTLQILPDGIPVDEDVAWLLGQIVGDGHVHGEGLNIAVYDDLRRTRIAAIMREWWGLEDHPQGGNARFYSRALRNMLDEIGLRVKSHQKRIPVAVLRSPPFVKRAFLAGYEEADGHLTKQGWQSLALTSETLAGELRGLYIELGEVVSNLAVEERAAVMAMPGGYTTENAKPLHRFQVYYGSCRRGAKGILQARGAQEQIGGEHFTLATVKSVVPDGEARTFDLEVEGEHNYIADGVVSHNCEELLLLTRAVRARARSRLAGTGILAISEDFSHAPLEATPDEDPDMDPFMADLRDAMLAPIANEGAASQVVPIVIRGTTQAVKDGIRHIQIVDPTQLYPETGLRTECIHRIALGLDMPPEILEGLQDSNHWTAWQIDDNTWTAHGMPVANQLVNDLTAAYFRPQMKADGVLDYAKYAIAYDASAIVNNPDKSKNALALYQARAVGKKYLRDAHGVNEEDAPTEDELNEMIGVAVRDGSIALYGIPSVKAGGIETEPGVVVSGQGESGTEDTTTSGAATEPGPPGGGEKPDAPALEAAGSRNGEVLAVAKLVGAADLALLRAREAAGNRLRSLAKRDPDTLALIEGVPSRDVPARLGRERSEALGATARDLVAGATQILRETLRMWGVKDDARATLLIERIERHAARTLFDEQPSPLPPTFGKYAAGVLERTP